MKALNKEELYQEVRSVLINTFELDADDVHASASLYEDLDLDSIDAVDLVITLQEKTGEKVDPEAFKKIRTVQDITDAVYDLLHK